MQPVFSTCSGGGGCLESSVFLEERRESESSWWVFRAPQVLEKAGGCTAAPADCLGQKRLCAWDCAFVPGCCCLTMEPTKGKASCLHKNKRFPVLEMGLCRAQTTQEGWWQNHHRAEGHMDILNPREQANVLCWLKLRETGFESDLFALSFTWAGKEELHTWAATRQWCSCRKPVQTMVAGDRGGQQPLPKGPREGTKLHVLKTLRQRRSLDGD